MAINWTTAQAVNVIREGKDKAAIQDIGRRFPLFLNAAAKGEEGLLELLSVLPEYMTARKLEGALKGDIEDAGEGEDGELMTPEEKPAKKEKPAKEEKGGKKGKAKPKPEEEEEDEDEEEEKPAKKGKGKKDEKPASKKGKVKPEPEEEEDDEDWDDEEEDEEVSLEDMSLSELKAEAKKRKVNIKGLKKPKEIIAAIKAADGDDEEEEEDEDDDWDI
jgi:hypothetical protein